MLHGAPVPHRSIVKICQLVSLAAGEIVIETQVSFPATMR
jgi:hypothetical protein